MRYLIVVAHPDDEVLGAGGAIRKFIDNNDDVAVCILVEKALARADLSSTLKTDEENALRKLGVNSTYHANFPNIEMNTVPHLEIVRFVEKCIEDFQANAIITHHPSDTNNDHVVTSYAVQAASRLFQRKAGLPQLELLMYMEVPSSTEWSFDSSSNRFFPNYFIEIGKDGIEKKLDTLREYNGVMRPYPHPRSCEAIMGLAAFRGAQAGCMYAEAFECVFRRA